jgi:hypothetical protein
MPVAFHLGDNKQQMHNQHTPLFATITVHPYCLKSKITVHSIFDIIGEIVSSSGLNSNTIISLIDAAQNLTDHNLPNSPAYLP